jgi:hypothetical protein
MTIVPAAVNNPILIKSRRETCPVDHAFRISLRFLWAFSASRNRALEALPERYTRTSPYRAIGALTQSRRMGTRGSPAFAKKLAQETAGGYWENL